MTKPTYPVFLGADPTPHAVDLCSQHGSTVADFAIYNDYCYVVTCANGIKCQSGGEGCGESCSDQCPPGTEWYDASHGCATNAASAFLQAQIDACNSKMGYTWNAATGQCVESWTLVTPSFTPGDFCTSADGQTVGVYDANGNCVQASAYPGDGCTTSDGKPGTYDSHMACLPDAPTSHPIRYHGKDLTFHLPDSGGGPLPPPPPPKGPGGGSPPKNTPPKQQGQTGTPAPPASGGSLWPWLAGGAALLLGAGGIYAYQEKKGPFAPSKGGAAKKK
jgi:hypothetical protein